MENNDISTNRKFHDSWAFFLYLIGFFSCVAFGYIQPFEFNMEEILNQKVLNIILSNLSAVLLLNFIGLFLFMTVPKALIYASLIGMPIGYLILFLITQNIFFMVLSIVTLINSLIIWYFVLGDIDFSCKIIKTACRILMGHFPLILFSYILFCSLSVFLIIPIWKCIMLQKQDSVALYFNILMFFWTSTNFSYMYDVLISAIVYKSINQSASDRNAGIVIKAYSITLYALGTICYASFIVSLVRTLKTFYRRKLNEVQTNQENQSSGGYILKLILYIIIGILIGLLESFIETMNRFLLPYVAVKGRSLRTSLKESFEIIKNTNAIPISTFCGANYAVQFIEFFGIMVIFTLNGFLCLNYGKDESIIITLIISAFAGVFTFVSFISCVSSGSLALIYSYATAKEDFKRNEYALALEFESKCF